MQIEPQIRFRGMEPSGAVEAVIRERIDRLARFHDRIISCSVVVDAPSRHGQHGGIFHVKLDIATPGRRIVTGRETEENHAHEDVYVAIRDAFDAAQRQLEDSVRRMTPHRVKAHPERLHGKVVRIDREQGFGLIAASDGRDYSFRREGLVADRLWATLDQGAAVHFSQHEGADGPYATSVAAD